MNNKKVLSKTTTVRPKITEIYPFWERELNWATTVINKFIFQKKKSSLTKLERENNKYLFYYY